MKVVFLDFDGVLNGSGTHAPASPIHPLLFLCPPLVERVNQICERTGAVVVLSTSWRTRAHHPGSSATHLSLDELREALWIAGARFNVIGATPDLAREDTIGRADLTLWRCPPRHKEIAAWVEQHRPTAFAILDDDCNAEIAGHFVPVEPWHGVQPEDVEAAVQILGRLT